jgi:hypothetical protein
LLPDSSLLEGYTEVILGKKFSCGKPAAAQSSGLPWAMGKLEVILNRCQQASALIEPSRLMCLGQVDE